VLQRRGGREGRMAFKQRQQQWLPHLGQRVWSPPATGFGGLRLDAAVLNPEGTAHP
jgi:hypothetical protein